MLRAEPIDRVLVFTRTKHGADKVVRALAKSGLDAAAIHGNKSQGQRERVLAAFRTGSVRTLIATDIAARGIDVEGISHVVNYDLPNIPESYVHRIGRTARAGADGIAISFCDAEERPFLRDIEKLIRMSIPATDRRTQRDGSRAAAAGAARPTHSPQQRKAGRPRTHSNDHRHRDGEQPQQRRAQQAQRHHGPKHNGPTQNGPTQKPSRGQQRSQQNAGSDGGIASVAFMQHKQRPHKQRPHARSGGGRAPQQSRH